jgi:predicted permease
MGWLRFFRRKHLDAELQEEINAYLEEEAAENMARGIPPDEARRQARIRLGNCQRVRETVWKQNTVTIIDNLWRDLRYATRTLARTPAFAIISIIVMALSIGANLALFTVVRGVLLKPLPFKEPNRLVKLYEQSADGRFPFNLVAGGVFSEWSKQNRSFSGLALVGEAEINLSGSSGQLPEKLHGASCTWNLLPLLGVRPVLGRNFTEGEDQHSANGTVLLSWSLWQRRFGGDPAVVDQTIQLNGRPYTIIGILPGWFAYPDISTQLWTPVYNYVPILGMSSLGENDFQALGRLKPGFTAAQGIADLSVITRRLHDQHPDDPFVGKAASIRPLLEDVVGDVKRPLYILLAAAGCVLLIACLNVANLLVARAAARRKELAIRTALGGGRLRLLREHLMESFLLSMAGGTAGLLLAYGAVEWLLRTRQDMARVEDIKIDGVVAAFTVGVMLLCALFSGLVSALNATDKRVLGSLHETSQSHSAGSARARLRKTLLAAEIGLTVVLLTGASLLLKTYQRLRSSDMGCITRNVLTMRLDLFDKRYSQRAQLVDFYTTLLARLRALPGVEAAGFVMAVPGQGYWSHQEFNIVEHPALSQGELQYAINRWADPGYFGAMGIPILRGRTFESSRKFDQASEAVISASFAREYFPSEDPIGKHLLFGARGYEIVGVVGDTRYQLGAEPKPIQYYPLLTGFYNNGTLVLRSSRDVTALALPVQRIIQEMDHDLPVAGVLTMDQLLGKSTLNESFNATLLTGFALMSLLLAAAGIFGVLSYIVAQRTNEIGIRMALGAQRDRVLGQVLLDGLKPAFAGLVFGLASSVAAVRLVGSMLYETRPLDPAVFLLVSVVLVLVAGAACVVPAWRASHLDPMQALRAE